MLSFQHIGTRMKLGTIDDRLSHELEIVICHSFWVGKLDGNLFWNGDFVDTKIRVGANDRSSREVDTLTRKVTSESTLFTLETLYEASDGLALGLTQRKKMHINRRTYANSLHSRCLRVNIQRNGLTQDFPVGLSSLL